MTIQEQAYLLTSRFEDIGYWSETGSYASACRELGEAMALIPDLAADLAQAAYDGGRTKKEIAKLLGIRPRDLTGMKKSGTGVI